MNATILASLSILIGFQFLAKADSTEPGSGPGIVIAATSGCDEKLVTRVRAFTEESYSCPTRVEAIKKMPDATSPKELEQALKASCFGKNDIVLLILINTPGSAAITEDTGAIANVALLNLAMLRPSGTASEESSAEDYARNAERASVRLVALALGMKPCPWPRCALYTPRPETDVGIRGRNLCPPCRMAAIEVIRSKGIKPLYERGREDLPNRKAPQPTAKE